MIRLFSPKTKREKKKKGVSAIELKFQALGFSGNKERVRERTLAMRMKMTNLGLPSSSILGKGGGGGR